MVKIKENIEAVWRSYIANRNEKTRHILVMKYIWLVKYVLQHMSLPDNTILDLDDFTNIGILGLHEAIDRYDPDRGVKFESYAIPRVRGIIQDELRRLDWLSRSARKKAHDYLQAHDELRSEVGREVSPNEIMKKLNITPEKYHSYLQAAAAAKASISLNESTIIQPKNDEDAVDLLEEIPDIEQENFLEKIQREERTDFIVDYLQNLNERKRLIMTLYYYENLTFKEIGGLLSVSESRVCQIHTNVIKDMRSKLKEFDNA
ncbi:MAG: sigma-70 family RNA polymerase sigma factor [Bacteroidota bacterium]